MITESIKFIDTILPVNTTNVFKAMVMSIQVKIDFISLKIFQHYQI